MKITVSFTFSDDEYKQLESLSKDKGMDFEIQEIVHTYLKAKNYVDGISNDFVDEIMNQVKKGETK